MNCFLEFKLPANQKLEPSADSNSRNEFIKRKYIDRKWAADGADFCSSFSELNMANPQNEKASINTDDAQIDIEKYFFENVKSKNFPGILASIVAGVDPNIIGEFVII